MSTPSLRVIDGWIRSGDIERARAALQERRKTPGDRVATAALLRRVGMSREAIRLLHREIHGTARRKAAPDERTRLEYAANLVRLGSITEATTWLAGIDSPEALLVRASLLVAQWRYAEAIPLYRRFLKEGPAGYPRLVCRVNLASALLHQGESLRAMQLLEALGQETSWGKHRLLYAVVVELKTQAFVAVRRYREAIHFVNDSLTQWVSPKSREGVLLRKWGAIATFYSGQIEVGLAELSAAREVAREMSMVETMRDFDRWEAVLRGDELRFAQVYLGTPHAAYRETLGRAWAAAVPNAYLWTRATTEVPAWDLETLLADATVGESLRRSLSALTRDFYRPLSLLELHEAIFPGEYFNPESSPGRVRQAMHRLREWLETRGIALRVLRSRAGYRLECPSTIALRVTALRDIPRVETGFAAELVKSFGEQWFSVADAQSLVPIPRRTVQRRLRDLVEEGRLDVRGAGRGVTYRIAS